jgi:hypothetical protein
MLLSFTGPMTKVLVTTTTTTTTSTTTTATTTTTTATTTITKLGKVYVEACVAQSVEH